MGKGKGKTLSVRRDPWRGLDPFDRLRELDLFPLGQNRVLDDLLRERGSGNRMMAPAVDVTENDKNYTVTAELPGIGKDDVAVEVHDGILTLRGEKRSERDEKNEKSRWSERTYGAFTRSFTLPSDADTEHIAASFKDGVLRLQIPKTEESKPKVVSVKSG